MGAIESSDDYELSPPPPSHSTLFVVRNGRYEPQNLMPVLPRPDMLDFDGFVVRRGAGHGRLNPNPPEMRQASLMKNPVSVRRDSVRVGPRGGKPSAEEKNEKPPSPVEGGETSTGDLEANAAATSKEDKESAPTLPVISFIFDALVSGNLTLHLLVTEVETPLNVESPAEEAKLEDAKPETKSKTKLKGPSYIKLVPQEIPSDENEQEKAEDVAFLLNDPPPPPGKLLDTFRIEKGLGQIYQSPPLDLASFPAARLAFDASRPKDVPICARLEADVDEGEEPSIQYTYISLANATASSSNDEGKSTAPAQWSAHLYSQKLQYGTQCFVLREVFGVTSKIAHDTEVEGGNSDCVICLSEPRDTAVLPCRHMCFCSYCAGIVRLQCDRCPVCRQKVQSLLQFKREADGTNSGDLTALSAVPKSMGPAAEVVTAGTGSPPSPSLSPPSGSAGYPSASASGSAGPTMAPAAAAAASSSVPPMAPAA